MAICSIRRVPFLHFRIQVSQNPRQQFRHHRVRTHASQRIRNLDHLSPLPFDRSHQLSFISFSNRYEGWLPLRGALQKEYSEQSLSLWLKA